MNDDSLIMLLSLLFGVVFIILCVFLLWNAGDCWANYSDIPLSDLPTRCLAVFGGF